MTERAAYPEERMTRGLDRLRVLARGGDEAAIRRFLEEFLPEATLGAGGPRAVSAGHGLDSRSRLS